MDYKKLEELSALIEQEENLQLEFLEQLEELQKQTLPFVTL